MLSYSVSCAIWPSTVKIALSGVSNSPTLTGLAGVLAPVGDTPIIGRRSLRAVRPHAAESRRSLAPRLRSLYEHSSKVGDLHRHEEVHHLSPIELYHAFSDESPDEGVVDADPIDDIKLTAAYVKIAQKSRVAQSRRRHNPRNPLDLDVVEDSQPVNRRLFHADDDVIAYEIEEVYGWF